MREKFSMEVKVMNEEIKLPVNVFSGEITYSQTHTK